MTKNNNEVEVSISLKATIQISEQMKDKAKALNPYAYNQYEYDDEAVALILFYGMMDKILRKGLDMGEFISDIAVGTI
jgi:hypothetical protein